MAIQLSCDSLDHADQTHSNQIYVYLPKEIKECVEYLNSLRENEVWQNILNQETISYDDAKALINDCRKRVAVNVDAIGEKNKKIIETYLAEYENFIEKPESWVNVSDGASDANDEEALRAIRQYEALLDMWVQHSLRARYVLIEGDENIQGNLQVDGNTILNNLTVNGTVNIHNLGLNWLNTRCDGSNRSNRRNRSYRCNWCNRSYRAHGCHRPTVPQAQQVLPE